MAFDSLNSPQVRFNWGFHDGQQAAEENLRKLWKSPHFNRYYEAGWNAGVDWYKINGKRSESSALAWKEFQASKKTMKYKMRKFR